LGGSGRELRAGDEKSIGRILQEYRGFIGTDVGVENLRKRMEALGITNARVTSVTEELSTGVRSFGFAIDRGGGAVSRATVRMDRFGNILRDTGNRFRSWSSAISNNLVKVVQWGLATGVVFGIMRGFRAVLREIIEIESELANVQIILGKGAGDLNTVFREAAEVADLTSTSIKGVIEGYTLAYQAAGAFEDPALRAAAANNLLQESMVLATLSGTDQAQAMDTLVGALRQTGSELTEGRELLDRWVAVSRESNVSLNTLAQTYAIVGATAQGLGLTFEELNALTATLAEATGLSATETGNAIRGIVAGFQSAQAEKVLDRFGVETRKATGELRDFWDLLNEVSFLLQSGAISPAELTEIANAIGGGYRRGAQVQTILEGMARAQQLVGVQMNASGEAADALDTKMATLQAAITRLGNAFTGLAQTLGDEGGFLATAKGIVEVLTLFVEILDRIVSGLGKATPALLTFGAAWLALQSGQGKALLSRPAGGLLTGAARAVAPGGANLLQSRFSSTGYGQEGFTAGAALGGIRTGVQRRIGGIDPLAALAVLGPALSTVAEAVQKPEGEREEGYEKAGAQIAGGVIGALVTGGSPIGALIGTAIAGAFADAVIDEDREIGGRIAEHFLRAAGEDDGGEETAATLNEELTRSLHPIVRAAGDIGSFAARTVEYLTPARGSQAFQAPTEKFESEDVLIGLLQGAIGSNFLQNLITDDQRALLEELIATTIQEGIEAGDIAGPFRTLVEAGTSEIEDSAGTLVQSFIEESQRQFVLGDLDVSDMFNISELSIQTIAPFISQLKEALSLAGVDLGVNELADQYLNLDSVSKQLLDTASRQVISLADQLAAMEESTDKTRKFSLEVYELTQKTNEYNAALQALATLQEITRQRGVLEGVDERPIVDVGRLTPQQIQRVRREADRLRDQTADAFADGGEEGADLWVEAMGDVLIRAGEGIGKEFIDEFFNQDPEFIKAAIENLGFEDALKEATAFGLRDLRDQLGVADFPSLLRRYEQVKSTITTQFPDYNVQEDPLGLILKDGFRTIHADQTLLNLAMQDLIDVNEQQLEGVWNLPSGMTAFVAWSSLFSRNIPADAGAAAWPFEVADDVGGTASAGGDARATAQRVVALDQAELQRLQQEIVSVSRRIQEPGADRATVEEGQFHLQELTAQYRQIANNMQAVTDRFLVGDGAAPGVVGVSGGVQEPLTAESIAQTFADVFQLENTIELNASIRLVVDGRTLANVVKEYLFTDLVQATDRSLGGGGGYVIEAE
jgi:TP901 family phage tail tape measure protein